MYSDDSYPDTPPSELYSSEEYIDLDIREIVTRRTQSERALGCKGTILPPQEEEHDEKKEDIARMKEVSETLMELVQKGDWRVLEEAQRTCRVIQKETTERLGGTTITQLPVEILFRIMRETLFGMWTKEKQINRRWTSTVLMQKILYVPSHETISSMWASLRLVSRRWFGVANTIPEFTVGRIDEKVVSSESLFEKNFKPKLKAFHHARRMEIDIDTCSNLTILTFVLEYIQECIDPIELKMVFSPPEKVTRKKAGDIPYTEHRVAGCVSESWFQRRDWKSFYILDNLRVMEFAGSYFVDPPKEFYRRVFESGTCSIITVRTLRLPQTGTSCFHFGLRYSSNSLGVVQVNLAEGYPVIVDSRHFFCRLQCHNINDLFTERNVDAMRNRYQLKKRNALNKKYDLSPLGKITTLELGSMDLNCVQCINKLPYNLEELELNNPDLFALIGMVRSHLMPAIHRLKKLRSIVLKNVDVSNFFDLQFRTMFEAVFLEHDPCCTIDSVLAHFDHLPNAPHSFTVRNATETTLRNILVERQGYYQHKKRTKEEEEAMQSLLKIACDTYANYLTSSPFVESVKVRQSPKRTSDHFWHYGVFLPSRQHRLFDFSLYLYNQTKRSREGTFYHPDADGDESTSNKKRKKTTSRKSS